jgi:hypothetical protein
MVVGSRRWGAGSCGAALAGPEEANSLCYHHFPLATLHLRCIFYSLSASHNDEYSLKLVGMVLADELFAVYTVHPNAV